MADLDARLRYFAAKAGITQARLAEALKRTPSAVSQWFSGDATPTLGNLQMIVDALKIDMVTFFGPIEDDDPDISDEEDEGDKTAAAAV